MFQERYAHLPLFKGLQKEQIDQVKPVLQVSRFSKDKVIFDQGQEAHFFYILSDGLVEIRFKPYDAPSLLVSHLNPGDFFGWSSILGHDTYSSAALSLCESEVLFMHHDDLRQLIKTCPETGDILLDRMASGIAKHLRSTHSKVLTLIKKGL